MTRSLPDQNLSLRDNADFILNSRLARKAMEETSIKNFPVFLRDLLEIIHSLSISCHMPEFTDHSLLHLCSLVDRVSQWTCAPNNGETPYLIEQLEPEECAILLVAILIHDIGMLSQKAEDLEDESGEWSRERTMGITTWVRKTHVTRMRKLIQRLFKYTQHNEICEDPLIKRAIAIAKAHEKWPWENGFKGLSNRDGGLAAVLAVSDLFDEDSNRCDTMTLIRHRNGTMLNIGHWIRHMLTSNKVLVEGGVVSVTFVRPPGTYAQLLPVYAALRNHFKLALLYNRELSTVGAGLLRITFDPASCCPSQEEPRLTNWNNTPGLPKQSALIYHLLSSFMPLALIDGKRVAHSDLNKVKGLRFEDIDLTVFWKIRGEINIHSPEEEIFYAIVDDLGVVADE